MGPRVTTGLREPPVKLDLRVLKGPKGPKGNKIPRPHRETGNNVRGRVLMTIETMADKGKRNYGIYTNLAFSKLFQESQ